MENLNSGMLLTLKCNECEKLYFPPRYHCNRCGASDFSEIYLKGEGEVYTYTIIRVASEELSKNVPYIFVEVKLDEGLVVPGSMVMEKDKEIRIGSRVSFAGSRESISCSSVNCFSLT